MTEYWKSTPKHWCEVCRVWIADTPRIVQEHERSTQHQDRVAKRLLALWALESGNRRNGGVGIAAVRREADKEASEAARVARIVHDVESKAFAAYAADLEAQEKLKAAAKSTAKKSVPASELHKGKRKITMEVPKHPLAGIGGYQMPKTGKIGGQQQKIVRDKVPAPRAKKIRVNENEEAKAKRLRREAQERVKQRNMLNFGLG